MKIKYDIIVIVDPPVIRCFRHGQSNPTYYVYYGGKHLVLRKKPVRRF